LEPLKPLPWQGTAWAQLLGARERLPHALLLHGARGIGKRRFARALAHALLCESPDEAGYACGRCAGCELLAADNHPDLRLLMPEADLPLRDSAAGDPPDGEDAADAARSPKASRAILIDQVRATSEFLSLAAHRGGRRVVIAAPAEALNGPAANALLKQLEEPPAGVVFVVVSDDLDAVLPTVRSRCVLLPMPMPDRATALAWLKAQSVADAEVRLAEAGGAPVGLEQEPGDDSLAPELKERLLGLLARGARSSAAEVIATVPRDLPVAAAIRLFQRWGWDLLAERTAGRVRYHPKHQRAIAAVAGACEPGRLLRWLQQLEQAQAAAAHPLNARLVTERVLLDYLEAVTASAPAP
jgi:DNA polymerase III subunit delta'